MSTSEDQVDNSPSLGGESAKQVSGDEARLGGDAALVHLVTALQDPDWQVGERAAQALATLGGDKVVEILIRMMHDGNHSVRSRAAYGLGLLKAATAIPDLIGVLDDESDVAQWSAARALEKIGAPAFALLHAVVEDVSSPIRDRAIEILGNCRDVSALPLLLDALHDDSMAIRISAILALAKIRHESAVPALIETIQTNAAPRQVAVAALGRLKAVAAIPYLLNALRDDSFDMRSYAAEALGDVGDPVVIPELIKCLTGDTVSGPRAAAANALVKIGDRSVLPYLLQALYDPGTMVRYYAARIYDWCEPSEVPALVRALLEGPYDDTRWGAADLLHGIAERHPGALMETVPALVQALGDTHSRVRWTVAHVLGNCPTPEAVQSLIERLADEELGDPFDNVWSGPVCDAAAEALRQIGTPEALAAVEAWERRR